MVAAVHMGWRYVLFANWPVPSDRLEPSLPPALELDAFDGRAWLTITPFTNIDVRPRILPGGTGFRLPELNLRTYVTHNGDPGVYFFSLDADGILSVLGARLFHHLPYYHANVNLTVEQRRVRFESRRRHPGARPATFAATYGPTSPGYTAEPGTLEYFLVERYRYYTQAPDGSLRYAQVTHEPWRVYEADARITTNTLFRANNLPTPDATPTFLYSPGVDTIASKNTRATPRASTA